MTARPTVKKCFMSAMATLALSTLAFATLPRVLPWALAKHRPDIRFAVAMHEKKRFLTIDDAPSEHTAEILRVLEKHQVPATFFVIANRVTAPAQLEAIVTAKHALGNHLRTTKACSTLSPAEFRADFDACAALLEPFKQPKLFRPASDFGTQDQIAYPRTKGHQTIMGTVFPLDHWISDPVWLARLTRWLAVPGGIIILHDGDTRGATTASLLDRVIPQLKAAGYTFGHLEDHAR